MVIYYKPFISKALRYGPYVTRDHTVLPATHTRTNICLYSPTARCHRSFADTHWYSAL